jgi:hypothetical protein
MVKVIPGSITVSADGRSSAAPAGRVEVLADAVADELATPRPWPSAWFWMARPMS